MLKDEKIIDKVEKEISFFPNSEIRDLANQMIYYYRKFGTLKIADFISYIANSESELKLFNEIVNMNKPIQYIKLIFKSKDDFSNLIKAKKKKKEVSEEKSKNN